MSQPYTSWLMWCKEPSGRPEPACVMQKNNITIAIDGYSACGKSTLAKYLAQVLGYRFIDTGAMYRAVTYYFLQHNIPLEDSEAVQAALENTQIHFQHEAGKNQVYLNGENISEAIRSPAVNALVSPVATLSAVRRAMVAQQRSMGKQGSIVMDGRDIGTVVFPDAELKIFVTADLEKRVERRLAEMKNAGYTQLSAEKISANLQERDHIDASRADSPLRQAEDAVLLDNSHLSFEDFLAQGLALAKDAIEKRES